MVMDYEREEAIRRLVEQIREWNENRMDLFELSEPNQDLEFFGVMRFFYQDEVGEVSTKCIRVSSTATTLDVLQILIEKFRPDLRMLNTRSQFYSLYEVHSSKEERRLHDTECPLLIQLNWGKDCRDGRFLLKRESDKSSQLNTIDRSVTIGLQRKLSQREKKELKKKEKESQEYGNAAERLYNAVPDSSFTRSISNPESVMRKRRDMKADKLKQLQTTNLGPDSGGTLKVYGGSIIPDIPYKTILLTIEDTTFHVVKETLEKYGLERENPANYCLVQVIKPTEKEEYFGVKQREVILETDDRPLGILYQEQDRAGLITFHLKRRTPEDMALRRWKSGPLAGQTSYDPSPIGDPVSQDMLPILIEVNPDGSEPYDARMFKIPMNGFEIGQEYKSLKPDMPHIQITGNDIYPRHCTIVRINGMVVVTPMVNNAGVSINGRRAFEPTVLDHGDIILLGRNHFFRFIDPTFEKRQKNNLALNQQSAQQKMPPSGPSPMRDCLPATLDYREEAEDTLLNGIIYDSDPSKFRFKLTPTYVAYMTVRHVLIGHEIQANEHLRRLVSKISRIVSVVIQENQTKPTMLAFWMANSSELLHFFTMDRDLGNRSIEAQDQLAASVQMAFLSLVDCLKRELHQVMHAFIYPHAHPGEPYDDTFQPKNSDNTPKIGDVISLLTSTIILLSNSRVNAALTIQLFSQLFHFINMWLFNRLIKEQQLRLCTRDWGNRLALRLGQVEDWAEKQGLELAAECHLARIKQAVHLLRSSKTNADDVATICSSCFKLNSIQLRALLQNYISSRSEPRISQDVIEGCVIVARNTADESLKNEGQPIGLLEEVDLQLPFLLPEEGYSCYFVKGISEDLLKYIEPFERRGICRLMVNSNSSGLWTVFFSNSPVPASGLNVAPEPLISQTSSLNRNGSLLPEECVISFRKINNSLGLSIVAAIGEGQNVRRIFVKSVIPNGAAYLDGRLQPGDEILEVDGQSLVNMSQEMAAEKMSRTGQFVTLKISKQSAVHHGLATQLGQPSPLSIPSTPVRMSLMSNPDNRSSYDPMTPQQLPGFNPGQNVIMRQHNVTGPNNSMGPYNSMGPNNSMGPYNSMGPNNSMGPYNSMGPNNSMGPYNSMGPNNGMRPNNGMGTNSVRRPNSSIGPYTEREVYQKSNGDQPDGGAQPPKGGIQVFPADSMGFIETEKSNDIPTGGHFSRSPSRRNEGQPPTRSKSATDLNRSSSLFQNTGGLMGYQQLKPDEDPNKILRYPSLKPSNRSNKNPYGSINSARAGQDAVTSGWNYTRDNRPQGPGYNSMRGPPVGGQQGQYSQTSNARFDDPRSAGMPGPDGILLRANPAGVQSQRDPQMSQYPSGYSSQPYNQSLGNSSTLERGRYNPPISEQQGQPFGYNQNVQSTNRSRFPSSGSGSMPPLIPPPPNEYAQVKKSNQDFVTRPTIQQQYIVETLPNQNNYKYPYDQNSRDIANEIGNMEKRTQQISVSQAEPEYVKAPTKTGPAKPQRAPSLAQSSENLRVSTTSPWVREEKEVERKKNDENIRRQRADEFRVLESRPYLSKAERDRLNRMKLEEEFDRKFDEVNSQEDQDDDVEMTPAGRAQLLHSVQEQMEFKRQQNETHRLQKEKQKMADDQIASDWNERRMRQFDEQREEERRREAIQQERRMQAMDSRLQNERERQRKHRERLEEWFHCNRRAIEDEKKQEIEYSMGAINQSDQVIYSVPQKSMQNGPPAPPERNSSYNMYQPSGYEVQNSTNAPFRGSAAPVKKNVSFPSNGQANPNPALYQHPQQTGGYIYTDSRGSTNAFNSDNNDVFIDPRTPESNYRRNFESVTPGVVGSQEIYLDPRDRFAKSNRSNDDNFQRVPDRMSFHDKMRHFASEAGEGMPIERPKISRAQQRLEEELKSP